MARLPFPTYCLHRSTDQAFFTAREGQKRKPRYLGTYGSELSLTRYAADLAEMGLPPGVVEQALALARRSIGSGKGPLPPEEGGSKTVTVYALYSAFMAWAPSHYRLPSGELSREIDNFRISFRDALELLGPRDVKTLARADLLAVRQRMVDRGLARKTINQSVGRVVRVVVWGGDEDRRLVPDSVAAAFRLVKPLKPFRGGARETDPVEAVPDEDLKAVLRVAHPALAAMLTLQLLTAARPGEVRGLKRKMVRVEEGQWVMDFGLRAHKMAYRGKRRIIPLGEQAVKLLEPWLATCAPDQHVFRPEQAPKARGRTLRPSYNRDTYTTAVVRACAKAGVPQFGPNRVRHRAAVDIRREFGLEAAQAVLGHSHFSTTERYAPSVSELAKLVATRRG